MQTADLPETRVSGSMAVILFELIVGTGVLEMGSDVVGTMVTEEVVPWEGVVPRETIVQEGRIVPEEDIVSKNGGPSEPEDSVEIEGDGEMDIGWAPVDAKQLGKDK